MRKSFVLLLVLVCSISSISQTIKNKRVMSIRATTAASPQTNTLPIRRVILYSNGVAYIERRGIVTGNAEVNLSFKQSQVDDVLKSMVVLDLGQGKIGAVRQLVNVFATVGRVADQRAAAVDLQKWRGTRALVRQATA